jgi:hypothetical protein
MKNKYGARKLTAPDGQVFDSVKEYHRWGCLRLLERAGKIKDLKRQVKYVLIPAQRDQTGKVVEREMSYIADFEYVDLDKGTKVVEDCKGFKTDVYRIKKKMMLWVHGIRIKET